jgi:DNA-directed RNA polymerase specialized sigma24 family protein
MAGAEPRVRDSLRSFAQLIDVEAVLQETLLRTWQVAPRLVADGRPDDLVRMAIRIGRNLAISECRRLRATPVADDQLADAGADAPTASPPDPLLRKAIAECRDKLPGKPREALDARLASAGGDDDDALATGLRMKLNTFLQNVTRARKLIADCLGKRGIAVDHELGA